MKTLLILTIAACSVLSLCAQAEYEKPDSVARAFDGQYSDAAALALQLTQGFQTEKEKARVIFTWIALNIRYDCKKYHDRPSAQRISGTSAADIKRQVEAYEASQVAQTLKKKKGICADYSRLFKAMCDATGLEATIVVGTARNFRAPFRKLPSKPNHAWNAVKIGGQWRLLDVTWAAGYADEEVTKFTAYFQPGYFLTPPERFVQNHFPEEERWQLLKKPVRKRDYPEQPLVNFGQIEYPIEDFSPAPAKQKEQMEIRLKFGKEPPALVVTVNGKKPLAATQTKEDGYVVLRFAEPGGKEIAIFVGESQREMNWLARYSN